MSSIGPQLPAELSKRKHNTPDHPQTPSRKQARRNAPQVINKHEIDLSASDPDLDSDSDSDSDDIGPSAPKTKSPGPAPAPAPAHQQPPQDDNPSDSEDDFGPSLPQTTSRPAIGPSTLPPAEEAPPQRDAWMLAPPPPPSSYSERDPTRLRARKFASKAKTPVDAAASSIWTETPEEKLRRQRNALLGRSALRTTPGQGEQDEEAAAEEKRRRIAKSTEASRGKKSLYEEHSERRKLGHGKAAEEDEDDPGRRPFDREKDMAIGGKIGGKARSELIGKSANFGGRFQKGSFL